MFIIDDINVIMFSVNGVPYPLNEYRKLIGMPTIEDIALACKWTGYGERK